MKTLGIIFAVLLLSIAVLAQGTAVDMNVQSSAWLNGQKVALVIPGAKAYICASPATGNPCTNTVALYSDAAMTQPIVQPLIMNGDGRAPTFFTLAGNYQYTITDNKGNLTGPYSLSVAPTKDYVDQHAGGGVNLASPPPIGGTTPNAGTFSALKAGTSVTGSLNGVLAVDGSKYKTLAEALADCQWPSCTIDARGNGSTQATTVAATLVPSVPTRILLGCYTYTGPASGSAFAFTNYAANGSSIEGCGVASANQPNGDNGTRIMSHAGNTSDLVSVSISGGVPSGLRFQHLRLDGNNVAVHALNIDAVRNSVFDDVSFENTTGVAVNAVVTRVGTDQGNQFNLFQHIRSNNVGGLLLASSHSSRLSDFTHNTLIDIQGNWNGTVAPFIELQGADTNHFYNVSAIRSGGDNTCTLVSDGAKARYSLQLDGVTATQFGAQNNYFYGVHLDNWCPLYVAGTEIAGVTTASKGNQIYGYDKIELQANPVIGTGASLLWVDSEGRMVTFATVEGSAFRSSVKDSPAIIAPQSASAALALAVKNAPLGADLLTVDIYGNTVADGDLWGSIIHARTSIAATGDVSGATVTLSGMAQSGKALCQKADKSIGYCSTVIAADGSCTCN